VDVVRLLCRWCSNVRCCREQAATKPGHMLTASVDFVQGAQHTTQ
jgi:hypothetical protein